MNGSESDKHRTEPVRDTTTTTQQTAGSRWTVRGAHRVNFDQLSERTY